jgi:hypothetical protein
MTSGWRVVKIKYVTLPTRITEQIPSAQNLTQHVEPITLKRGRPNFGDDLRMNKPDSQQCKSER